MAARERWVAAATEILGTPVEDAVPVARRKPSSALFFVLGAGLFAVVVFLHEFGVMPGPSLLAYFVGAALMALLFMLGAEPMFAALTRDSGLWMLTGSRISPRPMASIGPLEPASLSRPQGLFRNTFEIAGMKHQVGVQHKARFQEMVRTAQQRSAG